MLRPVDPADTGQVPTVCVEHVYVWNNTSVIVDEVLAHRIGMVPLQIDPALVEMKESKFVLLFTANASSWLCQVPLTKLRTATPLSSVFKPPALGEKMLRRVRQMPHCCTRTPSCCPRILYGSRRASRRRFSVRTHRDQLTRTSCLRSCVQARKSIWRCMPSKASGRTTQNSALWRLRHTGSSHILSSKSRSPQSTLRSFRAAFPKASSMLIHARKLCVLTRRM